MRGFEVRVAGTLLVDLNYDEAAEQGGDADEVEEEVDGGSGAFLARGVGWLED